MNTAEELTSAQEYCKKIAQSHYENFTVGSFLLPKSLRQHIYNIYAYCRIADDLADECDSSEKNIAYLHEWEQKLRACYNGETQHPVFVALADTIQKFRIPIQPFQDLLKAFRQDQFIHRYQTYNDLLNYCRHSANPVGRIYLYLFHLADDERFLYSDMICTALQLTNFWQDVPVDCRKGRIYVPLEDVQRLGCSQADFERQRATPAFRDLIKFEIDRTQQLFDEGKKLMSMVSLHPRFEISLFICGGESILQAIRKQNYDVLQHRPLLGKWDKLRCIIQSFWLVRANGTK